MIWSGTGATIGDMLGPLPQSCGSVEIGPRSSLPTLLMFLGVREARFLQVHAIRNDYPYRCLGML